MVGGWLWISDAKLSAGHRNAIAENGVPGVGGATRLHVSRLRAFLPLKGGLNLRRRGLDGDRTGRKFLGTVGCCCDSFAFPADASVPTIFKNYTMIGEFLTDGIG